MTVKFTSVHRVKLEIAKKTNQGGRGIEKETYKKVGKDWLFSVGSG